MNKSNVARWIALIMMVLFLFNGSPITLAVALFFGLEGSILEVKEEILKALKKDKEC